MRIGVGRNRASLRPASALSGRLEARRPAGALALLAFLGPMLALPVAAQPMFRLGSWTGLGELRFSLQQRDSESLFVADSMFDRQVAEELISLRNTLTVIDSEFLVVNYGFTLGLLQSQLVLDEGEDRGHGDLQSFDITATYRPISQRPVSFLWNRSSNDVPVEFAGTRRIDNESIGVTAGLGSRRFPGTAAVREFVVENGTDFDPFERGVDQRRRSLSYDGTGVWERHRLFASLLFEDVDDRITPQFSHRSQTVSVNHQFEILAPELATLRSNVRYFDRSGDLSSSSFYLDEELRLQHRRSFFTTYRYLDREVGSFSGPASRSQSGFIGLHHRLYQSLDTNLLFARTETRSRQRDSSTSRDEIGLGSTYRKSIPGGGQLTAGLNVRYDARDNRLGDGQELITDERHIARLGIPIRLERPGIFPQTVVVTDELKTTLYEEGVDYERIAIGDFTEITPLAGGLIRDGQIILVEYRAEAPVLNRFNSLRDAFFVSLSWGWIEPFWRYSHIEHETVEGPPSQLLTEQRDQSLGLRFRINGRRVDFVSINERRVLDSDIQAFEALRSGQGVTYRPARGWTLRLSLAAMRTDFTVPVRETRAGEARLGVRWMPRPAFSVEAFGNARQSLDTLSSDQLLERYGIEGRWTFGKVTLLTSIERWRRERTQDDLVVEDLEGVTATFRFSRRFFPGRLDTPRAQRRVKPWPADMPGLWALPTPDMGDDQNATDPDAEESSEPRAEPPSAGSAEGEAVV